MVRDVTYQEAMFENWKKESSEFGIEGIKKADSDLIIDYINDLEKGIYVGASRKGGRSFKRLNASRHLLKTISRMFNDFGIKGSMVNVKENILFDFFRELEQGKISKQNGESYSQTSIGDFRRVYKAFFNWYRRKQKKVYNKEISDITEDLSCAVGKTRFVYITKEQLDEILKYLPIKLQRFGLFLFDSIIRAPQEVLNLKGGDIFERDGDVWVNVPDEASKTFGRVYNLLFCGEEILKHKKENNIGDDDYLFNKIDYEHFNKQIKKIAVKLYGDKISHPKAEKKYSELSSYDFRHCGGIFLRMMAQKNNSISLDSIRQRGGWSDFEMLNYYTKFLGLTGEIKKESLLIQEDKSKLEMKVKKMKDLMGLQNEVNSLMIKKISGHKFTREDAKRMVDILNKISEMNGESPTAKLL